jgi:hypothetical protein
MRKSVDVLIGERHKQRADQSDEQNAGRYVARPMSECQHRRAAAACYGQYGHGSRALFAAIRQQQQDSYRQRARSRCVAAREGVVAVCVVAQVRAAQTESEQSSYTDRCGDKYHADSDCSEAAIDECD